MASPIPTEINHNPVVAFSPLSNRAISQDEGVVLVYRPSDRTYITWRVYERDGRWNAEHGHYDMDWLDAIADFKERI